MKLFYRLLSQLLIVTMVVMPFSTQAGMIATDQASASAQSSASRDKVLEFVSRGDVIKQFEALGIGGTTAQDRVNAMTQDEVNRIAGKIDALPAGGSWEWIAVIAIIGAIVYFVWYKR